MLQICENIRRARLATGKKQAEVAKELGIGRSTYANWEHTIEPDIQNLKKISNILDVPIYTLMAEKSETLQESEPSYQEKRLNKKLNSHRRNAVPLFDDIYAEGGAITETEMSPIHAPSGTIDIGDLLHDSQAAIRIYGNSMLPNYPPGCVVGLHKVTENFIEPGEVYVIETGGKRMLKRLFYKNDEAESEYITLYSDNTMKFEGGSRHGKLAYPPFDIKKQEIGNLFAVTGVIKRNTNSIIMHRNNKP